MFSVQLASALLLAQLGITGIGATILGRVLTGVLGAFLDAGILTIDIVLDKVREAKKLKEFEKVAPALWERTIRGRKTEAEKQKLREEYLAILEIIGPVGDGPAGKQLQP